MNTRSDHSPLFKILFSFAIWIGANFSNAALAAPIAEIDEQDLRVTLEQSAGENFHVHFTSLAAGTVKVSIFALTEPARLVIDVPGVKLGSSKTLPINHPSVTAMRIGVHPDKTRIVIDTNGTVAPAYSKSGSGSNVTVNFNIAGETPASADAAPVKAAVVMENENGLEVTAKLPENAKTPDETPALKVDETIAPEQTAKPAKPSPKIIYDPPIVERQLPDKRKPRGATEPVLDDTALDVAAFAKEDLEPSVSTKPLPKPDNSKPATPASRIEGLSYKMLNGSTPALMIKVTSLGEYSFRQRDKNIFEVVLENCQLAGDHLTQPHFPSEEFKGLEGTFMWQRDNSVVIKIYVEPAVRLTPYRAEGNLWIKVAN